MKTLVIDTHSETASVSVFQDAQCLATELITGSPKHAESIMSLVDELLRRLSAQPSDTDTALPAPISFPDEIAVCTGPGSFTGVRVGIATALGLSLSQRLRQGASEEERIRQKQAVYGYSSHHLLLHCGSSMFENFEESFQNILTLIDVKGGQVHYHFHKKNGRMPFVQTCDENVETSADTAKAQGLHHLRDLCSLWENNLETVVILSRSTLQTLNQYHTLQELLPPLEEPLALDNYFELEGALIYIAEPNTKYFKEPAVRESLVAQYAKKSQAEEAACNME